MFLQKYEKLYYINTLTDGVEVGVGVSVSVDFDDLASVRVGVDAENAFVTPLSSIPIVS